MFFDNNDDQNHLTIWRIRLRLTGSYFPPKLLPGFVTITNPWKALKNGWAEFAGIGCRYVDMLYITSQRQNGVQIWMWGTCLLIHSVGKEKVGDKNNVDSGDDDINYDKIMVSYPFCKKSFLTFWRWMSDGRQRDNIPILKSIWQRLNAQFLTTIKKESTTFSRA